MSDWCDRKYRLTPLSGVKHIETAMSLMFVQNKIKPYGDLMRSFNNEFDGKYYATKKHIYKVEQRRPEFHLKNGTQEVVRNNRFIDIHINYHDGGTTSIEEFDNIFYEENLCPISK